MFRLYLLLGIILPNIYVFFRIKHHFISKRYAKWYIAVYLIIILLGLLTKSSPGRVLNLVNPSQSFITEYIYPTFLYLLLAVLLYDVLYLINLVVKIVPDETRKSLSFRTYTLAGMILLSMGVVAGGAINLNTIRVSKYKIDVPRKNSKIDHLRVAFIADFHILPDLSLNYVEQFVRKVNALEPDLMLYGGDILETARIDGNLEPIESILRGVHAKHGSYGVLGNHESYGRREPGIFFRKSGITLLRDSIVRIDSSFCIAGRYDQQFRGRKSVMEIIGDQASELPLILMDHRPTELQETSLTPVDVQFSGHTHNGQLFPINLILKNMYELTWGYKKVRNTNFFVTSGLRLWGPPVKTAGKSEIMLVDIYFK